MMCCGHCLNIILEQALDTAAESCSARRCSANFMLNRDPCSGFIAIAHICVIHAPRDCERDI